MSQNWCAETYIAGASFVPELGANLLDLLAPCRGERILDLGCGDGVLTERIAAAGADVVGVDGAPDMVRAARARGLNARVMDGQRLAFGAQQFDAVFSNAALHWMPDADAVIDGVRRVLRPGGRFVGEFGGHGNVASIVVALHAALLRHGVPPERAFGWYFPTAEDYAGRLARHGFVVDTIALLPRPTRLPAGIAAWLALFAGPFLADVPQAQHPAILAEAEALLVRPLRTPAGDWIADYVRLRFAARL